MNTFTPVVALLALFYLTPAFADVTLKDPKGDDKGHGTITYPSDKVYRSGTFDLREISIKDDGDDLIIQVKMGTKIEDPWKSKEWDGNGFSLQFVQLYVDTTPDAGHTTSLPGMNVEFQAQSAWDKVIVISPQGKTRLQSEINTKAANVRKDVVIPRVTRARGKTLRAVVSKKALGGAPAANWGYQALVQSNEGYPSPQDLLSRKVNEYPGKHRFGGGNDYECDPHVIDMLAGSASGEGSEAEAQFKALTHFCGKNGMLDKSDGKRAAIPMIYPKK